MNVLIVDDHQILKDGIAVILKEAYSIDHLKCVSNGHDAVQMMENISFDLILLDISMPGGMDGLTLLELIREKNKEVKVIMLTMYNNISLQKRAYELGANEYLIKELSKREIISAIDVVLANQEDFEKKIYSQKNNLSPKKFTLPITSREKEIFILTVMGYSLKESAEKLRISVKTVENHRLNISKKLNIYKRQDWIEIAMKYDLI